METGEMTAAQDLLHRFWFSSNFCQFYFDSFFSAKLPMYQKKIILTVVKAFLTAVRRGTNLLLLHYFWNLMWIFRQTKLLCGVQMGDGNKEGQERGDRPALLWGAGEFTGKEQNHGVSIVAKTVLKVKLKFLLGRRQSMLGLLWCCPGSDLHPTRERLFLQGEGNSDSMLTEPWPSPRQRWMRGSANGLWRLCAAGLHLKQ